MKKTIDEIKAMPIWMPYSENLRYTVPKNGIVRAIGHIPLSVPLLAVTDGKPKARRNHSGLTLCWWTVNTDRVSVRQCATACKERPCELSTIFWSVTAPPRVS